MSSSDLALRVANIGKHYSDAQTPVDRLKRNLSRSLGIGGELAPELGQGGSWALRDVSFDLRRGEAMGVVGRNGAGKSTLLQIVCGTLKPTTGSVQVSGRIAALLELGAGFHPEFTGRENVYLNGALLGLSIEQIDERFDAIAAFADIGASLEQPVKTYSSGMFMRLAFAVVANADADILVVDEALAVGDALFTQKCMRFIREFKQRGALLYVSHDSGSVTALCDRALWLHAGQTRMLGSAKMVCEGYLNALFGTLDQVQPAKAAEKVPSRIERLRPVGLTWRDQRTEFVNGSNVRNDIRVFRFEESGHAEYGGVEARITNVRLLDAAGNPLSWVVGGEKVVVRIDATAHVGLQSPIFGFMVRDRLGQNLFGDNTYLARREDPLYVPAGFSCAAEFEFHMPWLAGGDYVIQVALAEGTQAAHRQLHWVHDALAIRAEHDAVATGLIGIPMMDIRIGVAVDSTVDSAPGELP